LPFDVVIRRGTIVDGTGEAAYTGDLGIVGDRIACIGEINDVGRFTIDAEDCVVSPGFIDVHSHTDEFVFANPTSESKVFQGVTTEVSGNCGYSAAPRGCLHDLGEYQQFLRQYGLQTGWSSMSEFLAILERLPKTINFATFVGHGTIRSLVMGFEARTPTCDELANMQRLIEECMEAGALGLSTGLAYAPGCYADTEELIRVAEPVARYGGIYATHIRDEADGLVDAVAEAIKIAQESRVSVQISHHKACGQKSRGKVRETLAMIDAARAEGLDVWVDVYPYIATSTSLKSILPQCAHDGGSPGLLARLRNAPTRETLRAWLIDQAEKGRIWDCGGWASIVISLVEEEKYRSCEGQSIDEIARKVGKHPADVVLDLLSDADGNVGIIAFVISDEDVAYVIGHPVSLIGSDATARAKTGPLSAGKPHPRAYGTFPRVLRIYVRENRMLRLEEAISKMTGRTARRLGLKRRGFLREGYYADIVVFEPNTLTDTATFENPHSYAQGIRYVLVNGQVVLENGHLQDCPACRPGRILRRAVS